MQSTVYFFTLLVLQLVQFLPVNETAVSPSAKSKKKKNQPLPRRPPATTVRVDGNLGGMFPTDDQITYKSQAVKKVKCYYYVVAAAIRKRYGIRASMGRECAPTGTHEIFWHFQVGCRRDHGASRAGDCSLAFIV
jgi:hypothetical protein